MSDNPKRPYDDSDDDNDDWLCDCGHFVNVLSRCSFCGAAPPWGCDDGDDWDEDEEYDGDDAWDYDWERP